MSIHAHPSREAESNLETQRRSSMITSFIIAFLSVVLLLLILFFILLPALEVGAPITVVYSSGSEEEDKIEQRRINREVIKKPSAPSSAMAKVLASATPTPTAVPVPDFNVIPSTEFGSRDDFGRGWGTGGDGGGGGYGKIPATMKKRSAHLIGNGLSSNMTVSPTTSFAFCGLPKSVIVTWLPGFLSLTRAPL